jgi:hypothetical protein
VLLAFSLGSCATVDSTREDSPVPGDGAASQEESVVPDGSASRDPGESSDDVLRDDIDAAIEGGEDSGFDGTPDADGPEAAVMNDGVEGDGGDGGENGGDSSAWRPPAGTSYSRGDPAAMARIRRYYGLASAGDLSVVFEVGGGLAAPDAVRAHLTERLVEAGIPARAFRPDGGTTRSLLVVGVRGEAATSEINAYGRVRLVLRYRTTPGGTIEEAVELDGPFRLSRVSSADAAVNSLYAVGPELYGRMLAALDRGWQRRVASVGLLYRVVSLPDGEARGDVLRVLEYLGVQNGSDQWLMYDTPPMIARELRRILVGSDYGFSLDPLTGEIRIVYNDNT